MKVVALGEVMMRVSTPLDKSILKTESLDIYFGGGEYNTLVNLSGLGHDTEIVTAMPDNGLASRVLLEAKAYGVGTKYTKLQGERLGTYYALLGNEITPTNVIYDRAHSSFANSKLSDYNFEDAFEDADLFHVSGITAALNDTTKEMTLEAIKLAKKMGLKVSYDSNYRAKLWTQKEAGDFMCEVLPLVDYAFLGILDMKYLLDMDTKILQDGYRQLKEEYPNIEYFASTTRNVITPNKHTLKVNIYTTKLHVSDEMELSVKDRIGGGDVFTGGILDGIMQEKPVNEIASFALADAAFKHYQYGDNCFVTRGQIESIVNGTSMKISR